ncbi:HAD-IA family hydrolase [Pseudodonghicola xiamenensis]|uniref:Haloacid dehalogenase n=1 Tax=Pseudodonghicola xiamenensis TaxID=337702 RepID=A0A8J3H812_9RHOB|nr:HAD-IA family hydrolase [Pseudodonghicola xiamenensis]GHG91771.1 haloacid dehalogenase [Pseudodonghicola xiamenensis]
MSPKEIRPILDVDGVLVTGRPADGLRRDHQQFEDTRVAPDSLGRQLFARDLDDIVTGRKALLPPLSDALRAIGSQVNAEDLAHYWFDMASCVEQAVLADCRAAPRQGLAIYLAINQEHMRARYLMQTMKLDQEVDGIVYSAQAGCRKHQPEFFAHAAEARGFAPRDLLLVDDTQDNVETARQADWQAVHWTGAEALSSVLQRCISR